jgi:hypothetical protein
VYDQIRDEACKIIDAGSYGAVLADKDFLDHCQGQISLRYRESALPPMSSKLRVYTGMRMSPGRLWLRF